MKIEIFALPYLRGFHREQTDAILQDLQAKQENVKRFMILN